MAYQPPSLKVMQKQLERLQKKGYAAKLETFDPASDFFDEFLKEVVDNPQPKNIGFSASPSSQTRSKLLDAANKLDIPVVIEPFAVPANKYRLYSTDLDYKAAIALSGLATMAKPWADPLRVDTTSILDGLYEESVPIYDSSVKPYPVPSSLFGTDQLYSIPAEHRVKAQVFINKRDSSLPRQIDLTLAHELGHVVLGHPQSNNPIDVSLREFQADAVSYGVLKKIGVANNPILKQQYLDSIRSHLNTATYQKFRNFPYSEFKGLAEDAVNQIIPDSTESLKLIRGERVEPMVTSNKKINTGAIATSANEPSRPKLTSDIIADYLERMGGQATLVKPDGSQYNPNRKGRVNIGDRMTTAEKFGQAADVGLSNEFQKLPEVHARFDDRQVALQVQKELATGRLTTQKFFESPDKAIADQAAEEIRRSDGLLGRGESVEVRKLGKAYEVVAVKQYQPVPSRGNSAVRSYGLDNDPEGRFVAFNKPEEAYAAPKSLKELQAEARRLEASGTQALAPDTRTEFKPQVQSNWEKLELPARSPMTEQLLQVAPEPRAIAAQTLDTPSDAWKLPQAKEPKLPHFYAQMASGDNPLGTGSTVQSEYDRAKSAYQGYQRFGYAPPDVEFPKLRELTKLAESEGVKGDDALKAYIKGKQNAPLIEAGVLPKPELPMTARLGQEYISPKSGKVGTVESVGKKGVKLNVDGQAVPVEYQTLEKLKYTGNKGYGFATPAALRPVFGGFIGGTAGSMAFKQLAQAVGLNEDQQNAAAATGGLIGSFAGSVATNVPLDAKLRVPTAREFAATMMGAPQQRGAGARLFDLASSQAGAIQPANPVIMQRQADRLKAQGYDVKLETFNPTQGWMDEYVTEVQKAPQGGKNILAANAPLDDGSIRKRLVDAADRTGIVVKQADGSIADILPKPNNLELAPNQRLRGTAYVDPKTKAQTIAVDAAFPKFGVDNTIAHEMGHILAGHTDGSRGKLPSTLKELEANAVAYGVQKKLGVAGNPRLQDAYLERYRSHLNMRQYQDYRSQIGNIDSERVQKAVDAILPYSVESQRLVRGERSQPVAIAPEITAKSISSAPDRFQDALGDVRSRVQILPEISSEQLSMFEPPKRKTGLLYLPNYLTIADQKDLLNDLRTVVKQSPLFIPTMSSGVPFKYKMTNIGDLGWISDRQGYRYESKHPVTGQPYPEIPSSLRSMIDDLSGKFGEKIRPDAVLLNWYSDGAKLGLHVDNTEKVSKPVVSLSLGDRGVFAIDTTGSRDRSTAMRNLERINVNSGDAIVFGGDLRNAYHSVERIDAGTAPAALGMKNSGRINLTARQVQPDFVAIAPEVEGITEATPRQSTGAIYEPPASTQPRSLTELRQKAADFNQRYESGAVPKQAYRGKFAPIEKLTVEQSAASMGMTLREYRDFQERAYRDFAPKEAPTGTSKKPPRIVKADRIVIDKQTGDRIDMDAYRKASKEWRQSTAAETAPLREAYDQAVKSGDKELQKAALEAIAETEARLPKAPMRSDFAIDKPAAPKKSSGGFNRPAQPAQRQSTFIAESAVESAAQASGATTGQVKAQIASQRASGQAPDLDRAVAAIAPSQSKELSVRSLKDMQSQSKALSTRVLSRQTADGMIVIPSQSMIDAGMKQQNRVDFGDRIGASGLGILMDTAQAAQVLTESASRGEKAPVALTRAGLSVGAGYATTALASYIPNPYLRTAAQIGGGIAAVVGADKAIDQVVGRDAAREDKFAKDLSKLDLNPTKESDQWKPFANDSNVLAAYGNSLTAQIQSNLDYRPAARSLANLANSQSIDNARYASERGQSIDLNQQVGAGRRQMTGPTSTVYRDRGDGVTEAIGRRRAFSDTESRVLALQNLANESGYEVPRTGKFDPKLSEALEKLGYSDRQIGDYIQGRSKTIGSPAAKQSNQQQAKQQFALRSKLGKVTSSQMSEALSAERKRQGLKGNQKLDQGTVDSVFSSLAGRSLSQMQGKPSFANKTFAKAGFGMK